jgi:putative membrane protein
MKARFLARNLVAVLAVMASCIALTPFAHAGDDNDKKFLATASQANLNEIKLSELAVQKATNPAVKRFAERMVKEHNQLGDMMKPYADSWTVAAPTQVDADHQKEWDKLNGLSGKDFDKEYMSQMVSDHGTALSDFTSEAKDTKDRKFRATVLRAKTMIAAHKNMAYDLKKKL